MNGKNGILIALALLLIAGSGYFIWSETRQSNDDNNVKRTSASPLIAESAQAGTLSLQPARNKEGRRLQSALEENGVITWRCLALEEGKKEGINFLYTSLILGGPDKWDGKEAIEVKDAVRKLHHPPTTCSVQTPLGVTELKPLNGVSQDPRLIRFARIYLVDLFRRGYGAVLPGQDIAKADIKSVPGATQVKRLQGFDKGSSISCSINGVPKTYTVRLAKSVDQVPAPCQMLVYQGQGRTVWSLKSNPEANLVVKHEF
jgi:hypothetical protein